MKVALTYLKDRLEEQTTWVGIGAAIVGAATLTAPYSYLAIAAGVIAVLVPQTKGTTNG